jgi:hypothetical protein
MLLAPPTADSRQMSHGQSSFTPRSNQSYLSGSAEESTSNNSTGDESSDLFDLQSPSPHHCLEEVYSPFTHTIAAVDPPGTYVDGENIYDTDPSNDEDESNFVDEFETELVAIDDVNDLIDGCIEEPKNPEEYDDDNVAESPIMRRTMIWVQQWMRLWKRKTIFNSR